MTARHTDALGEAALHIALAFASAVQAADAGNHRSTRVARKRAAIAYAYGTVDGRMQMLRTLLRVNGPDVPVQDRFLDAVDRQLHTRGDRPAGAADAIEWDQNLALTLRALLPPRASMNLGATALDAAARHIALAYADVHTAGKAGRHPFTPRPRERIPAAAAKGVLHGQMQMLRAQLRIDGQEIPVEDRFLVAMRRQTRLAGRRPVTLTDALGWDLNLATTLLRLLGPVVTVGLRVENTYEKHRSVTRTFKNQIIQAPPAGDPESDAYAEWAYDNIYEPFTGVGHTSGDSWYDVTITASSDPTLLGRTFDWGY